MAARGRSLAMCFAVAVVLVAAAMFPCSEAVTHVVGDAAGWSVPSNVNDDMYENWAMGKTFTVGDVLVFNFTTGEHDVAVVSSQAYEDCLSVNAIKLTSTGPANITLTTAGMHYFICTKAGHCNAGQELKINVVAAATGSSGPSSSPGTTTTTTTGSSPSNSGSSMAAASIGVFATAFATVVAFLY